MAGHPIFRMCFARVYPFLVAKAEGNGRSKAEVDEIILWLTGYSEGDLGWLLKSQASHEKFFGKAPRRNPSRKHVKGVVCGVRVEDIENPKMQEIRYLDKLIGELAKGKAMDRISRE